MAATSGAFGANAGFNQSAGGYYVTLSSIQTQLLTLIPGSGSGGAATVGTFTNFTFSATVNQSSLLGVNRVIKDMGRTVVSAGRTFRKFQAVVAQSLNTDGVTGDAASTTNPGYLTGYLEISKEGFAGPSGALIARYA